MKAVHTVFVNLRMKKAFFANRVAMGEVTGKAAESINGVRLIKPLPVSAAIWRSLWKRRMLSESMQKILQNNILFRRQYDFLQQLYQCGDISSGRPADKSGLMSFGELVAFFLYVGLFMKPLMQLLGFIQVYQRGMAGFKRFMSCCRKSPRLLMHRMLKFARPARGTSPLITSALPMRTADLLSATFR